MPKAAPLNIPNRFKCDLVSNQYTYNVLGDGEEDLRTMLSQPESPYAELVIGCPCDDTRLAVYRYINTEDYMTSR